MTKAGLDTSLIIDKINFLRGINYKDMWTLASENKRVHIRMTNKWKKFWFSTLKVLVSLYQIIDLWEILIVKQKS